MAIYTDVNQTTPYEKAKLEDVQAVFQAIENILSTRTTERFFNPAFGIDLESILFDQIDDLTALEIFTRVTNAIQQFEPRVVIDFGQTTVLPDEENNKYDVDIVFFIRGFDGQKFVFQDSITNDQVEGAVA